MKIRDLLRSGRKGSQGEPRAASTKEDIGVSFEGRQPPAKWPKHLVSAGPYSWWDDKPPDPKGHREQVEPWLTALFQAEHLNLLVGSGLTTAIAHAAGAPPVDLGMAQFECDHAEHVRLAAERSAERLGRGEANLEDQIRAARELIGGLRILAGDKEAEQEPWARMASQWEEAVETQLRRLLNSVLETESRIHEVFIQPSDGADVRRFLGVFLLAFASRSSSRERLHIFTTNYDRLLEYGCDFLGLRIVDRFVGTLAPVFRSSRLGVDLHYNPPGMRGEPRYLEGVVRLTKLHGSVDWWQQPGPSGRPEVKRYGAPFGAPADHPAFPQQAFDSLLIYPNPAKDFETLEYPYAELFRDFAAAVCQPNVVLVTYGYGFGDDHVNRIIRDMLTIPSTHLVVISFDDAGGRAPNFVNRVARYEQITLLIGNHFAGLPTLIQHYLPKPAIDRNTWRMVELLKKRTVPDRSPHQGPEQNEGPGGGS